MGDLTVQQVWIVQHKLNENQRRYVLPRYNDRKKRAQSFFLWDE